MKQATFIQMGNVFQAAIADEHGKVLPLEIDRGQPACFKTVEAAQDYADRKLANAPRDARNAALLVLAAVFLACGVVLYLEGGSLMAVVVCGVFAAAATAIIASMWRQAVLSARP